MGNEPRRGKRMLAGLFERKVCLCEEHRRKGQKKTVRDALIPFHIPRSSTLYHREPPSSTNTSFQKVYFKETEVKQRPYSSFPAEESRF